MLEHVKHVVSLASVVVLFGYTLHVMIIQEMKIRTIIMKTWVVNVEEDENGDAYIQLPDEVLQHANLKEGDTVVWTDNKDGSWSLQKKVDDV